MKFRMTKLTRRGLAALLVSVLGAVSLTGCLNDLTPQGRWSAPVSDGDFIYVGNVDGVLVRVDANQPRLRRQLVVPIRTRRCAETTQGSWSNLRCAGDRKRRRIRCRLQLQGKRMRRRGFRAFC